MKCGGVLLFPESAVSCTVLSVFETKFDRTMPGDIDSAGGHVEEDGIYCEFLKMGLI